MISHTTRKMVNGRFPVASYRTSMAGKPEFMTRLISRITNMQTTMMGMEVRKPISMVRFL
jgi:hypothetical protein